MVRTKRKTIDIRRYGKKARAYQLNIARNQRNLDSTCPPCGEICERFRDAQSMTDLSCLGNKIKTTSISSNSSILDSSTSKKFKRFKGAMSRFSTPTQFRDKRKISKTHLLPTTITDLNQLHNIINVLRCPQCCNSNLTLNNDNNKTKGLAVFVEVYCEVCEDVVASTFTSERVTTGRGPRTFAVNKQAVLSSVLTRMGHSSLNSFCELMNMPGLHHKSFDRCANNIYLHTPEVRKSVFTQAINAVRTAHKELHYPDLDNDSVIDISVSFDGSWLTRGHSSNIGVGCVVDILTGLCIDLHVMSTYCQKCDMNERKFKDNENAYKEWFVKHSASCSKNFDGSSGMMEVEAARVLWRRSIERNKMRYVTMLSDGDSKTHSELCSIKPYGPDYDIEKEECVNHVSKRLGAALRNVVADTRKQGITLGGRGEGRLTQVIIGKLTLYYARAIRGNNESADAMANAIWATLFHAMSSDKDPHHDRCPTGVDSWCFFQNAIANHRPPPSHNDQKGHTRISREVGQHLIKIYQRLTDSNLLKRCLQGKTQNSNECLHSTIWARCSKDRFASHKRVELAAITACGEFNQGASSTHSIMSVLGLSAGRYTLKLGKTRNLKRLQNSKKYIRDKLNRRREMQKMAKLKHQQELQRQEGGRAYAAGQF